MKVDAYTHQGKIFYNGLCSYSFFFLISFYNNCDIPYLIPINPHYSCKTPPLYEPNPTDRIFFFLLSIYIYIYIYFGASMTSERRRSKSSGNRHRKIFSAVGKWHRSRIQIDSFGAEVGPIREPMREPSNSLWVSDIDVLWYARTSFSKNRTFAEFLLFRQNRLRLIYWISRY